MSIQRIYKSKYIQISALFFLAALQPLTVRCQDEAAETVTQSIPAPETVKGPEDAFIKTTDFTGYLAVAEDLNIRIMEIVDHAGTQFTLPGRAIRLEKGPGPAPV